MVVAGSRAMMCTAMRPAMGTATFVAACYRAGCTAEGITHSAVHCVCTIAHKTAAVTIAVEAIVGAAICAATGNVAAMSAAAHCAVSGGVAVTTGSKEHHEYRQDYSKSPFHNNSISRG